MDDNAVTEAIDDVLRITDGQGGAAGLANAQPNNFFRIRNLETIVSFCANENKEAAAHVEGLNPDDFPDLNGATDYVIIKKVGSATIVLPAPGGAELRKIITGKEELIANVLGPVFGLMSAEELPKIGKNLLSFLVSLNALMDFSPLLCSVLAEHADGALDKMLVLKVAEALAMTRGIGVNALGPNVTADEFFEKIRNIVETAERSKASTLRQNQERDTAAAVLAARTPATTGAAAADTQAFLTPRLRPNMEPIPYALQHPVEQSDKMVMMSSAVHGVSQWTVHQITKALGPNGSVNLGPMEPDMLRALSRKNDSLAEQHDVCTRLGRCVKSIVHNGCGVSLLKLATCNTNPDGVEPLKILLRSMGIKDRELCVTDLSLFDMMLMKLIQATGAFWLIGLTGMLAKTLHALGSEWTPGSTTSYWDDIVSIISTHVGELFWRINSLLLDKPPDPLFDWSFGGVLDPKAVKKVDTLKLAAGVMKTAIDKGIAEALARTSTGGSGGEKRRLEQVVESLQQELKANKFAKTAPNTTPGGGGGGSSSSGKNGKFCNEYARVGVCDRQARGETCSFEHKIIFCNDFAKGNCSRANCRFMHEKKGAAVN